MTEKVVHSFPADEPNTDPLVPCSHPPMEVTSHEWSELSQGTQPLIRPKKKLIVKRKKHEFDVESDSVKTEGLRSSTPTKEACQPSNDCSLFSETSFIVDESSSADPAQACSGYGRHTVLDCSNG